MIVTRKDISNGRARRRSGDVRRVSLLRTMVAHKPDGDRRNRVEDLEGDLATLENDFVGTLQRCFDIQGHGDGHGKARRNSTASTLVDDLSDESEITLIGDGETMDYDHRS